MVKNNWKRSTLPRKPAELGKPLIDPAIWYPGDLSENDHWIYRLSDDEILEVDKAVGVVVDRGLDIKDITHENFSLPNLGPRLQEMQDELMEGRGIVLIQGLPIERLGRVQYAAAFWGISLYIGRALSQNRQGHLLGHVKDVGGDYSKTRGYRTKSHMAFHCDQADILALGCIHTPKNFDYGFKQSDSHHKRNPDPFHPVPCHEGKPFSLDHKQRKESSEHVK